MRVPFVIYGFNNENDEQLIVSVIKQVFHVQVLEIESHKFYFKISQKRLGIDNGYYTKAMQMFALELNKEVLKYNISFNCDILVPYGIATKILKSKYGSRGTAAIDCLSWYGDQCILSVKEYLTTDFSKGEKSMNIQFIRGKIISGSRDLDTAKCWMQATFPDVYFMECDNGYYFEIPIDNNLFTNPTAFYMYLNEQINKDFAAAPDFYLCLITSCGVHLYETYLHFKLCFDNITKALYVDETVLDTVYKWLKWDKLHKEYNK